MAAHAFCPGYAAEPFRSLVADYPGEEVYPSKSFRTEWGPIFHRGRLDGTARVLVIGQDPAAHEDITRRILVGEAGQRVQGFLARLGITSSYVYVNTFLYSIYGQPAGEANVSDPGITLYRNRWLSAIASAGPLQAVVTLGHLADQAYELSPLAEGGGHTYVTMLHPTYPESASSSGAISFAEAMARLCRSWNKALATLDGKVTPDGGAVPGPPQRYGNSLTDADLAPIPEQDLPPGLPDWMRSLEPWAQRTGDTAKIKRATITVTVPASARP